MKVWKRCLLIVVLIRCCGTYSKNYVKMQLLVTCGRGITAAGTMVLGFRRDLKMMLLMQCNVLKFGFMGMYLMEFGLRYS